MKLVLSMILICVWSFTINAQQAQEERAKNKVEIFDSVEKDRMQLWFYEQTEKMNLSQDKLDEYYSVILYYTVKMKRLDDKDMELEVSEIETKLNELIAKQNKEVKDILSDEQYEIHKNNFEEILRSVKNRLKDKK
ncbi:hypothetical protein [Aquimarina rhabdastrellae]